MEHFDETGHGKFDDGLWNIVMSGVIEHCDDKCMYHCDDRSHRTF